jgi:hypothetical protein
MTRKVADTYDDILRQYAPPPAIWERLTSIVRMDYQ